MVIFIIMVIVFIGVAVILVFVARHHLATYLTLFARHLHDDTSADYGVVFVQGDIRNFEI